MYLEVVIFIIVIININMTIVIIIKIIINISIFIIFIFVRITISSIVMGLRNSYFPLIHLPGCYRTVCYRAVQQATPI